MLPENKEIIGNAEDVMMSVDEASTKLSALEEMEGGNPWDALMNDEDGQPDDDANRSLEEILIYSVDVSEDILRRLKTMLGKA